VGWQEPIGCGGVAVHPDDLVIVDSDGAVLVPAALVEHVVASPTESRSSSAAASASPPSARAHGSAETILRYSSSVKARSVSVRTLPREPARRNEQNRRPQLATGEDRARGGDEEHALWREQVRLPIGRLPEHVGVAEKDARVRRSALIRCIDTSCPLPSR
jgi:hypothetical protein